MTAVRQDRANPDDPLSPVHRHMLTIESGIAPEVIASRGYRTITIKSRLRDLGFGDRQYLTPGLLLPIWDLNGAIASYQFRPDQPRIGQQGKAVKYETRQGSPMLLDVSPLIREQLKDVRIPLLITEGIKKADAAISRGGCCVALLGVWNWRGRDGQGATRLLPEFERIPLRERLVYLIFDSDCLEKPAVAQALTRLGRVLRDSFHAAVQVVQIPVVPPVPDPAEEGDRP